MSPKPVIKFGKKGTDRVTSLVNAQGNGVAVYRGEKGDKPRYFQLNIENGSASDDGWQSMDFSFPGDAKQEVLESDQPFYLGGDTSNTIIYLYEAEKKGKDPYSIQYAYLSDLELKRFKKDKIFYGSTAMFAQGSKIAVIDFNYNYWIFVEETVFEFDNPGDPENSVVQSLQLTNAPQTAAVALTWPVRGGQSTIRWWLGGEPVSLTINAYDENDNPQCLVCFDDYIVWSDMDNSNPTVNWVDSNKTPGSVGNSTMQAGGTVVALARSGSKFYQGNLWFATSDGDVYHVDPNAEGGKAKKVISAKDVPGGSKHSVAQLWADDYFLWVLTGDGSGAAWKIKDVSK